MSLILRYIRLHRREFLLGFLCLIVTNALTLLIPWLLKDAIEALRDRTSLRAARFDALAIILTALVLAVVRTWSRLLILGASRRIVYDVRDRLYAHLLTLPASFYARHRTGEIMSRAVNDLMLIRSLFGPGMLNVLNVALLYSAGLTLMAFLDPVLTLAAVLPYPFILWGVFHVSRTIHERSNRAQQQLAEISNEAQETLSGINMVKAFAREEGEARAFAALSGEYRRLSLLLARSRGLIVTLMGGLGGVSVLVVLWLGGRHVIAGSLTLGGLVAFMSYLALLSGPTVMMGWVLGVFQRGLGAIRRVLEILAQTSDLPGDRAPGPGPAIEGAVTFRGLRFAYPDGAEGSRSVLQGIDLDVPAGTTVGLVGRVGSGKSTLVHLVAAVHPVPDGTLRIDGRDINTLPTASLRSHVAVVPQETFLFSRSIAENIALGAPRAPRGRIEEVARVAQITRDLPDLPQGLDTLVGERGVTLSGGQRQRVALARALLLDPRILILDDALSSVDADTEEAILAGLREFMRRRTTFVVSHRVSTVMGADRIVVLEDGRVVESGTASELLDRDGPFARLHMQQQIEQELESP
ncbi:MAG TPA: ABC transporter ATP-binding protein [Candidatus Polarisedimenticolia bacterium]|nr:ABC transporter ATP-binding protein [Candidatus Polarisedimenticolia bacterium]